MALCNSKLSTHFQVQQPQPILFLNFIIWLTIFLFLLFPFANSISFNFSSFNTNDPDIQCQGDATINEDTGELQLTKYPLDSTSPTSSVGRATYSTPMHLWDPETGNLEDFNTYFSFIIVPSNTNSHGGDGLSFFLSPQNATIPIDSTGGYLGLFDSSNLNDANNPIVAVEFDTYQNSWDPSPYHVGIDVNSIESVPGATVNLLDGSIANNVTANAWVVYDSTTKTLSVNLSYEEYPNLEQYYNLSCRPLDLQNVLPEWVRVGFSGATGTGVEKYNILSWSFDSSSSPSGPPSSPPPSVSPSSLPPLPTPGPSPNTNQRLVIYLPVGIGSLICGVGLVWFIQLKTSFLNLPSYSQVKNCFSGSRDQASPKAPYGSSSASYDQTKPYGKVIHFPFDI
ncbi:hypothetical protein Vadar_029908 [Vaccinium darrowii]|uniref:Uncharacterized protein n=1 Tax=Vaccinium darrowii TaxID=229202 RepID=A0ACB7Z8I3_9ERIC|nr:hypothetical protein Vadar_029908 [Vaccinium darrowii]